MRFVFFGTSDFSVAILEKLISDFYYPSLVVAQPAKPTGRKQQLAEPPIKHVCEIHHIPVIQPERVKDAAEQIRTVKPDLLIVAAYGQIIPQVILDSAPLGAVNVHTSLLPAYRGASPIQAAILNGEAVSGITIMKMDAGMDHGPIILQASLPLSPLETAASLHARLATLGADVLTKVLPDYTAGRMKVTDQDHSRATFTKLITKDQARIDWNQSAAVIERTVRAYYDWPGAWTIMPTGKRLKIEQAAISDRLPGLKPGEIGIDGEAVYIGCASLCLQILAARVEGKQTITAAEFARGYHTLHGQSCV